jgi:hypothetical protein
MRDTIEFLALLVFLFVPPVIVVALVLGGRL